MTQSAHTTARLSQGDGVAAHVDKRVAVVASGAQEVAPVLVHLGSDCPEHDFEAALSALPHGSPPLKSNGTPSSEGATMALPDIESELRKLPDLDEDDIDALLTSKDESETPLEAITRGERQRLDFAMQAVLAVVAGVRYGRKAPIPCDECEHPTLCADFPEQHRTCVATDSK